MVELNFRRPIISKERSLEKQSHQGFLYYQWPYSLSVEKFFLPVSLIVVLSLFLWRQDLAAQTPPKELPVLVTIKDLLTEPNPYDGHRVVAAGRIRSIELQTGRRGSEFIMLVLEEIAPDATEPNLSIEVISLTLPKVRQGNHVLVQGIYHREGKQAGRSFERFIDADAIIREKS